MNLNTRIIRQNMLWRLNKVTMKTIPFRIVGIETSDFFFKKDVVLDGGKVDVTTNFMFAVNKEAKLVKCIIDYTYVRQDDKIMSLTVSCIFAIELQAFGEMIHDNKFVIEPFFSQYLATINVGAARGELHARCELNNSPLANVILPPINLAEALPNDVVIEI